MNKEVIIFSPSFNGQTTFYGSLADEYLPKKVGLLAFNGWANIYPKLTQWHDSIVLSGPPLKEDHPALWTLPRAASLLPQCVDLIKDFKPGLVIADYRVPEGILAAKKTNTPIFVSIPTVIGPFNNIKTFDSRLHEEVNLQALLNLEKQGIKIDRDMMDMIFGNFHFPGDVELVHSYNEVLPSNFKDGRIPANYLTIGNHSAERQEKKDPLWYTPTIFISFGKRTMSLLKEKEDSRGELLKFIQNLANKFSDDKFKVVLETSGHNVLPSYPSNWIVADEFKERDGLPEKTILISPGDSDSFHGGLLRQLPMIIVPFVDGQKLIGERVEALGVGVNLGRDWPLGDKYDANYFKYESTSKIPDLIVDMFSHFNDIQETFDGINLTNHSFYKLIKEKYHLGLPIVPERSSDTFSLNRGQLVFGTDIARLYLEKAYGLEGKLKIRRGEPFSTIAPGKDDLPATIDKYLDSLRFIRSHSIDIRSGKESYVKMLESFEIFLNGEKDLSKMCIKGLDFFAELFGIKFLVNFFDPKLNYITAQEMAHVIERPDQFEGKVFFYHEVNEKWQKILPKDVFPVLINLIGTAGDDVWKIERQVQEPIPWNKGVYIDGGDIGSTEVIRQEIINRKGDDEFTTHGELKPQGNKHLLGIEKIVFDCANRLKKSCLTHSSVGIFASISHGLVEQGGEAKNAVVVMLVDAFGRTGIGKADEFTFLNAKHNTLLQNAFSSALKQME